MSWTTKKLLLTRKEIFKKLFILFCTVIVAINASQVAAALDMPDTDSNLYRTSNNIVFYDPNDNGQAPCGENAGSLTGSENLEKIFNYFKSKGLNNIQAAAAIGNIDQESGGDPTIAQGRGHLDDPSSLGTAIGAGKAWGIIQWDAGGRAIEYAKQAGITGPINLLETQVQIVWWHMTNSSPTASQNMLKNFNFSTEGQLLAAVTYYHDKMEGSADSSMANRLAKAKNALRKYGGGAAAPIDAVNVDPNAAATPSASTCGGASTGSAVATAVNYAWPTYHQPPYTKKKPTYEAAVKKAQSEGRYVGGGAYPGVDCGGFVTLVMQDSGTDKDYNKNQGNTIAQREYMRSSPLYEEIHPTSTGDMKPGDIAVNSDHTYMYVGKVQGFETEIASASISYSGRSWRAPMAGHERPADGSYSWFRIKKAAETV